VVIAAPTTAITRQMRIRATSGSGATVTPSDPVPNGVLSDFRPGKARTNGSALIVLVGLAVRTMSSTVKENEASTVAHSALRPAQSGRTVPRGAGL
jgi:hypothetical protein